MRRIKTKNEELISKNVLDVFSSCFPISELIVFHY